MTGVSYMIPFVAAGGILIALGFLLGSVAKGGGADGGGIRAYDAAAMGVPTDATSGAITGFNYADLGNWAFIIFWLGKAAFAFFIPVLAGYIAFAIADRPGLAPGFVAGALATGLDGNPLGTGTGFLGALIGGALAGYVALLVSRWKVASWIRPLMPVVIIPLLASLAAGFAMVIVLKVPIKAAFDGLNGWLTAQSGATLAVVGIILGLMMAFDMGGPVNKVAYGFATTGLAAALAANNPSDPRFTIMAIVMAAGMTPPLGMALATLLNKKLYDDAERENGKAAWLLGASFISEGAIPFAAADPIRVIPSIMAGSAVTGAIVGAVGATLPAPHGGIFVFPLVGNLALYVVAILVGTAVTAFLVNFLKGLKK
jgi:PTS system fructose-specific IIC component